MDNPHGADKKAETWTESETVATTTESFCLAKAVPLIAVKFTLFCLALF